MSNIFFYSNNACFADDLISQIAKYAPEFKFCDDENVTPDVVIIDTDIKEYKHIREIYKNSPLIFLYEDKHDILESNLNIAIKKPFILSHFIDVLRSANNKLDNSEDGYLNFGSYQLRPFEKEIECLQNNEIIRLTEKEVDIIKYLYKHKDIYISKSNLQKNVWKYNDDVSTHTVETHIYRLRCKVEKKAMNPFILTNKSGYKLNME